MADVAVATSNQTAEIPVTRGSIIDTVDGPGTEKRLAQETEDTPPEKRVRRVTPEAPKKEASKTTEQVAREAHGANAVQTPQSPSDAEQYFLSELSDAKLNETSDPDLVVDEPLVDDATDQEGGEQDQNLSNRANKRIRALVSRTKQAEQTAAAHAEHIQKLNGWASEAYERFQSVQSENAELKINLARLEARMEAITPKAAEDPAEQHVQRFKKELAEELVSPQIKALQDRVDSMVQAQQDEKERYRQQITRQKYSREADTSVAEHLLKGYPNEIAREIGPILGDLALAYAYGRNTTIAQAAQELRPVLLKFGLGHLRARANSPTNGQAVARSQATTPPAPRGNLAVKQGGKLPSLAEAKAAGFKDTLDWMTANKPGGLGAPH